MNRPLIAILVFASGLTLIAQQQPTFRTRTDVVAIDVSVMDGKKPVTALTKDDFRLMDDGVAQTLMDMGREQMPLDVTLTIDVSGSVTPQKRAAIERAVRQVSETLRPDDRCSVVSFGAHILEESVMNRPPVQLTLSNRGTGGTSFLDALLLSLVTAPSIGRRQLNLFLTDGVDTTSFFNTSLVRDTLPFSTGQTSIVLVRGGGTNLKDGPVKELLKAVTATGGGQIVELDKDDQLKDKFLVALDEFRTSYLLRYAPTGVPRAGWHPVTVTVGKGKYTIRARQGYWSGWARLTRWQRWDARSLVRTVALCAVALGALWVVGVVVTGGFSFSIGGRTFSSHEPMRPLYWSTLPLALFVWANGVERTARACSTWIARIDHRFAAIALALGTFAIGVTYASTAAIASDSYGYVSEADLWLRSDLRIPQPWAAEAPWPDSVRTFSPVAYRPAGTGSPTDIVPIYSPGLPLLMAAVKAVGGHGAVFLVVPIAGAVLVLATWGIGRRWGSSAAGLIAALFVASSPTFLCMLAVPMSDVPAAACWTLGFYLLLRPGVAAGFGAGVAAGLAILIRPNLVWLAGPPGAWLLWHALRPSPGSRRVGIARLFGFSLGVTVAALFIALLNARLYGSPLQSGYGDLGPLFAVSNIGINARHYLRWLIDSQTPLILIGLAAVVWPARRIWRAVRDRTIFWVVGACVVGLWIFYLLYLPWTEWGFLRFFLIAWPFIMLGLAAVIVAVSQTGPGRLVLCTGLVVLLGIREFNDSRLRGAFEGGRGDREFVAAARATQAAIPATSVVFAELHSGSLRYYGGRMTINYVWLDGAWLDRAVTWLDEHGAPSYALLSRDEARAFKAHFDGSAMLVRFDAPPVFVFPETGLALYALSSPFPGPTQALRFDSGQLRSAPPVPPLSFGLR